MSNDPNEQTRVYMRKLRTDAEMTAKEFATALGIKHSTVRQYEMSGGNAWPKQIVLSARSVVLSSLRSKITNIVMKLEASV